MSTATTLIIFALLMAGAWWMSGYDSAITGEDPKSDIIRRTLRCGVTAVLLLLTTLNPYFALFIFVLLGVIWASCGAEFFARRFHKILDPDDDREFDPKETNRKLDLLARLTREGRTEEALELCTQLEASSEASALALETMVHRLYLENLSIGEKSPLLAEVQSLCKRGQFEPAESRLEQILAGQSKNSVVILMVMRVYAEDLSRPEKARALLQSTGKQPQLHPAFVKFARQSIDEWSAPAKRQTADVLPASSEEDATEVSIDELLKNNQLATAVEFLQKAIANEPQNFDLQLKLAEVFAVNCADLNRAGKIIQKMENSATFTPQEMKIAKARLKDWRAERR